MGQSGFPWQAFESIKLAKLDSLAGDCLDQEKILQIDNITENEPSCNHLNYHRLPKTTPPKNLIAIPLTTQGVETALRLDDNPYYGVLYCYLSETEDPIRLQGLLDSLNTMVEFIAEVYLRAIVHDRILLRQEINNEAFSAKDLNSFSHKVLQILQKNWSIEAASIYIKDERTQILRLSATTKMKDTHKNKDTIFISLKNKALKNCVYQCYDQGKIILTTEMSGEPEAISMPLVSIISVPIFHPAKNNESEGLDNKYCIGVLKCINKLVYYDNRLKGVCVFNFADKDRMTLLADIISVIATLFWRVAHVSEDFERTVHGVLNNVVTIRAALSVLDRHGKLNQHLIPKLQYAIPDSMSHLDALKWQIEKFSNRDRKPEMHSKKVSIHDDVLAKALQIANPLAHYFNVKLDLNSGINTEALRLAPAIDGDPDLLVTVFRNLIENSIKYSQYDEPCKIGIWWEDGINSINIFMQDNGIGIDDEDSQLIFSEGYRAEEAIRRVTSGASSGLGLFQCQSIMRELNGNIILHNNHNPTTFRITLLK